MMTDCSPAPVVAKVQIPKPPAVARRTPGPDRGGGWPTPPLNYPTMTLALFVQTALDDPLFFGSVVFTVIISITLHELAHGWMAIRLGDDTPIRSGRMTPNPMVHMGLFSMMALLIVGIAWGQMPIDHTRIRGRHGAAWVALAGPAMNLLLAVVTLTALGIYLNVRGGYPTDPRTEQVLINLVTFFWVFGSFNLLLMVFNLLPVPPLDGSHVLASFHRGYGNFISNPSNGGPLLIMFVFAFMFATVIFDPVRDAAQAYLVLLMRL